MVSSRDNPVIAIAEELNLMQEGIRRLERLLQLS